MNRVASVAPRLFLLLAAGALCSAQAGDWPMWRHDAARSGITNEQLPAELHLQWTRALPPTAPAWPDQGVLKAEFDQYYKPVVLGKRLIVGSSRDDSVTAYDTDSGAEVWRFYTDGPVRQAPAAGNGKVYVASDDGYLYCLDAEKGALVWKFRGGPADRRVIGNGRLVSMWPARGGPALHDGKVYFAASIWPFAGVFVHALDASTGAVVWTNDGSGSYYTDQGHKSPAFAGPAPQGELAVGDGLLIVPSGRSQPAGFDLKTGALRFFQASERGSPVAMAFKQGFFCANVIGDPATGEALSGAIPRVQAADAEAAYIVGDELRAYDLTQWAHGEYKDWQNKTLTGWNAPEVWRLNGDVSGVIRAGNTLYAWEKNKLMAVPLPAAGAKPAVAWSQELDGEVSHALAADGKLFVVTEAHKICCFGGSKVEPKKYDESGVLLENSNGPNPGGFRLIEKMQAATNGQPGYGLFPGIPGAKFLSEVNRITKLQLIALDPDAKKVEEVRTFLGRAYGPEIAAHRGSLLDVNLPPYFASVVVALDPPSAGFEKDKAEAFAEKVFHVLRPYGGTAFLKLSAEQHAALEAAVAKLKLENAKLTRSSELSVLTREGALPGAGSWTHNNADAQHTCVSQDARVKLPLGLLWFGGSSNADVVPRHGHGPLPQIAGGRIFVEGPDSIRATDVYTGRVLWKTEFKGLGLPFEQREHFPGANATNGNYVSLPDAVYVAHGRKIVKLDPATGKTAATFELPPLKKGEQPPVVGYLGVQGGLLVAGAEPISYDIQFRELNVATAEYSVSSRALVAMDRDTGEVRWVQAARNGWWHNGIVLSGDTVFAIDRLPMESKAAGNGPPRVVALDAATGAARWSDEKGVFGTWLGYHAGKDLLLQATRSSRDMIDEPNRGLKVYRAKDGSALWQDSSKKYRGPCLLRGGEIIAQGNAFELETGKFKTRKDPLTGAESNWNFARNYGCNTANGSLNLLTFRSAAAGFFDLANDGGTGNWGGFRASCTNNLIAADGVLAAPDYTRACTCSYQNQTSLALVHTPDAEVWTFNELGSKGPIARLGLNLGAPGDRRADDGTLWLEFPVVGGASPKVNASIAGPAAYFRRYALAVEGGVPWIASSGVQGLTGLKLTLDAGAKAERTFTVELHFAEPDDVKPGARVFSVALNGKAVLNDFDVAKEAGGRLRGLVKTFPGVKATDALEIQLTPKAGVPLLCGVSVREEGK